MHFKVFCLYFIIGNKTSPHFINTKGPGEKEVCVYKQTGQDKMDQEKKRSVCTHSYTLTLPWPLQTSREDPQAWEMVKLQQEDWEHLRGTQAPGLPVLGKGMVFSTNQRCQDSKWVSWSQTAQGKISTSWGLTQIKWRSSELFVFCWKPSFSWATPKDEGSSL